MAKTIEELRAKAMAAAAEFEVIKARADRAMTALQKAVGNDHGASLNQVKALIQYADNGRKFAYLFDSRMSEALKRRGFIKHVNSGSQMVRFSGFSGCTTNSWEELTDKGIALVKAIRGADWTYITPLMAD